MAKEWDEWKAGLQEHCKKLIDVLEKAGVPRAEAVGYFQRTRDDIKSIVVELETELEDWLKPPIPVEEEEEEEEAW